MSTTADRLAEQIKAEIRRNGLMLPEAEKALEQLAALAQQQATQEAQAECTCATKDMPFGRCCKAPRIVAWLCQYRSGEEFASLARNPLNDPDVCSAIPLYATQPSPCIAKELSEAETAALELEHFGDPAKQTGIYAKHSLTEKQIDRIFDAHQEAPTMSFRYLVTQAIEAHHGIPGARPLVDEGVKALAELERLERELRHYNPAGDEHDGKYIHKVWAREIRAIRASIASTQEKT